MLFIADVKWDYRVATLLYTLCIRSVCCISSLQARPGEQLIFPPFSFDSKHIHAVETVTQAPTKIASCCLGRSADRQVQINTFSNIALHTVSERNAAKDPHSPADDTLPGDSLSAVSAGSYWLLLLTKD